MQAIQRSERITPAILDHLRRAAAGMAGRPLVVAIEGLIGSGKSTAAETLLAELGAGRMLSTDLFILVPRSAWRSQAAGPEIDLSTWYDIPRLADLLLQVRRGSSVRIERLYDVRTGTFDLDMSFDAGAIRLILVEGLFALHARIRPLIDIGIWVDTPAEVAYRRYQERDRVVRRIDEELLALKHRIYHERYLPWAALHREAADLRI
jgi:uridine kinase